MAADFKDRKIPVAKNLVVCSPPTGLFVALIRVKPEVQQDSQVIQQTYYPR